MTNPLADALRDLLTAHHGGLRPTKEWEKAEEAIAAYDAGQQSDGMADIALDWHEDESGHVTITDDALHVELTRRKRPIEPLTAQEEKS